MYLVTPLQERQSIPATVVYPMLVATAKPNDCWLEPDDYPNINVYSCEYPTEPAHHIHPDYVTAIAINSQRYI
jgi:hypothetical protein